MANIKFEIKYMIEELQEKMVNAVQCSANDAEDKQNCIIDIEVAINELLYIADLFYWIKGVTHEQLCSSSQT